jgi:hypothetical protein
MIFELIKVEGYSGFRANERPIAFNFKNRRHEVEEIIERWYEGCAIAGGATFAYFRVRTYDGELFLLRYNSRFKTWAIKISD